MSAIFDILTREHIQRKEMVQFWQAQCEMVNHKAELQQALERLKLVENALEEYENLLQANSNKGNVLQNPKTIVKHQLEITKLQDQLIAKENELISLKEKLKGNSRNAGRKSRFTPIEFADMKAMYETGSTFEQIAVKYSVTSAYIRKIVKGAI